MTQDEANKIEPGIYTFTFDDGKSDVFIVGQGIGGVPLFAHVALRQIKYSNWSNIVSVVPVCP